MELPPNLEILGLDECARTIITSRWNTLNHYLSPYFDQDLPWYTALRLPMNTQQRAKIEATLEQCIKPRITQSQPAAPSSWEELGLMPLANALGFVAKAEQSDMRP